MSCNSHDQYFAIRCDLQRCKEPSGGGSSPRSLSRTSALGAAWAADSPTLFSTASGVFGLAAGPSAGLRPADYRVRPLCLLRSHGCAAGRQTRYRHTGLPKWASAPLLSRSATACGGALARSDGSDLLPLRLHLHCQSAEFVKTSPTFGRLSRIAVRILPVADARFVTP
jgi:hypothetical protein